MHSNSNRKSLLIILSVASIVISATLFISIFARGYRLDPNNGFKLKVTGLLSATSKPKSASVYVDDLLVTATDDTLNLNPGNYQIKISKDGYYAWKKNIEIKPELVYQADAQLFRSSFDLKPITQGKIINPVVSPDSTKIIYAVASTSATSKENGLYLLELTELPLLMSKNTQRFLSPNLPYLDWSKYSFEFSPNSKQILATSKTNPNVYLISLDQTLDSKNLFDISSRLPQIKKDWQNIQSQTIQNKLEKLPLELKSVIATDSTVLAFNTSEDKILYQASESATLSERFITPPPTQSTQAQQRTLQKDSYYIYDFKDDTNFLIGNTAISQISWIPYSNNLVFIQDKSIGVVEYDHTNYQSVYSTEYLPPKILLPTPDGYRLIISISTSKNNPENLFSVTIKDR
ncbi:MAG: hypothetical protein US68_C0001G0063 [Candidatus Shapirobacteria bacterium GW2011_GWE1_38_10]|uniref:PEGA domain-containing protein n=1 Tax=Candidatus Shapirobacteria bacterium GW2011_GWE1_38_10 TaxID=1618488 RepID=A0A0G0KNV4_9BACT|nr:MAG: hypothetical protein US46_C0004G0019 [Candidatus Shapirobacteria bacterium GW2011_GWF2_37_20]KKQ50864.1 MAG: hypothetical protein US68_C0001G0063 [Candidatus Shapirobacteria bacterium GW2011_GWE1_38_10]KKQ63633.1 MAG: hypothetical protein US85_C0015G0015 [Candidatus Shapirobacteria bacterium GW2011_GWF1_38_23]HBP51077.1 hypothetical protein [Candidatus Shapirobacteria bacterium]